MLSSEILAPAVAEMLSDLERVFLKYNIDFYLVGAVARDLQFSANERLAAARATKDVDLAIKISDAGQYNSI